MIEKRSRWNLVLNIVTILMPGLLFASLVTGLYIGLYGIDIDKVLIPGIVVSVLFFFSFYGGIVIGLVSTYRNHKANQNVWMVVTGTVVVLLLAIGFLAGLPPFGFSR